MPPTRTLMTRVQQNRNSRYLLSTVEKMHGFFRSRPLFWKSLFGVILHLVRTWPDQCSPHLHFTGFPFAFGIFQEYYTSNLPFAGSRNIPIIGTCAMGLMYLSTPLVLGLFAWYPNSRRRCILIGLSTMCLSLGLSSLSQTVPHLIASQGVIYAIGGALCCSLVIAFMDEWFVKRKGLAFGIMWVCLHSLTSNLFCLLLRKWAMKLLCVS
jgi:MFS family permease